LIAFDHILDQFEICPEFDAGNGCGFCLPISVGWVLGLGFGSSASIYMFVAAPLVFLLTRGSLSGTKDSCSTLPGSESRVPPSSMTVHASVLRLCVASFSPMDQFSDFSVVDSPLSSLV